MSAESNDIPTVEVALEDPYSALMQCRSVHLSHTLSERSRDNAIAAAAYAITYAFDHDHQAWGRAVIKINNAGLVKPKIRREKHSNIIREKVILVIFRNCMEYKYHKSYKIARALHYCNVKNINPKNVLDYIEQNGGIKGLYEADSREFPRRKKHQKDDKFLLNNPYTDLDGDEPATEVEQMSDAIAELERVLELLKRLDGRDRLVVELDQSELPKLIALEPGKRRSYDLRRGAALPGGWISFTGQKANRRKGPARSS